MSPPPTNTQPAETGQRVFLHHPWRYQQRKTLKDSQALSSEGYGDRIVIAQDIGEQYRLHRNGGQGYFYIVAHLVPRMRARGFTEEAIHKLLVENPKRILTFGEAKR